HARRLPLPVAALLGGSNPLIGPSGGRGGGWPYEQWGDSGCPGWTWDDVSPMMQAIENFDGEITDTRSTTGPMDVRTDFARNRLQEDMLAASVEAGVPFNPDYNSGSVEGGGRIQLNVRDGKRLNSWRADRKPRLG